MTLKKADIRNEMAATPIEVSAQKQNLLRHHSGLFEKDCPTAVWKKSKTESMVQDCALGLFFLQGLIGVGSFTSASA